MEANASVPVEAKQRLEFSYDYMSRRIQKKVYVWNVGTGLYQLQSTTKFVYDGWNLITEADGSGALVRSYVRGGGELLLINGGGNTYQVGYDGNQNVGMLTKASDGSVSASYDYDPFGQTLKAVGEFADQNPFRFSSEYADGETGLIYYGFRYYNGQTGRWINRDPSEEEGGLNLYGFVRNDGANNTDLLGLWSADDKWTGGWHKYSGSAIADQDCDTLGHLAFLITGYENDWKVLGRTDKVQKGERVNIAPLLTLLEDRLRNQVVVAATRYNTEFVDWTDIKPLTSANVNRFFGSDKFGESDCTQGWLAVYAKAVIEVFGAEQFDKWGFSNLRQFNQYMLIDKPTPGRPGDMLVGDAGYIENYPGYGIITRQNSPNHRAGPWIGENIVKVGKGRYWGFIGASSYSRSVKSISVWEADLKAAYARVGGSGVGEDFPGFTGRITFIDTAQFARRAFDERNR